MAEFTAWAAATVFATIAIIGSVTLVDIASDIWRNNKAVAIIFCIPLASIVIALLTSIVWVALQ